jgi:cytidine deaminase
VSTLARSDLKELIDKARDARKHSYAPYSNYRVGAALRAVDGQIFTGVNVENCAFPTSMCAERNALATAVGEGVRLFDSIVIATQADDKGLSGTPCGACRQALAEFGLDLKIVLVTDASDELREFVLQDLLPQAFTPESL